jgi:hypothetical protein
MRTMTRLSFAAVFGLVLLATTGCGQQLGALLYYVTPEAKNKGEYKIPPSRMAILIDDPYGALPRSDLRTQIHATIVRELADHKVQATIIPLADVARLEQANRDFDNLSIRAVGEQVHADQVLYVSILSFTTGEDAKHGVYSGSAKAQVKVCSTQRKTSVRLWPPTGDGYTVTVIQPRETTEEWGSSKAADVYAATVADRLARRIAMLFYEHSAETEDDFTTGRVEKPQ